MVQINNSFLTKELVDGANIQVSREQPPTQLAEKVVPVMEVNPKLLRYVNLIKESGSSTTGNTTIWTTPTDRETYITAAFLAFAADVTADSTLYTLTCIVNGVAKALLTHRKITLTAGRDTSSISFPIPIKVDKGTNIVLTQTFTAGTSICTGMVAISQNFEGENFK